MYKLFSTFLSDFKKNNKKNPSIDGVLKIKFLSVIAKINLLLKIFRTSVLNKFITFI